MCTLNWAAADKEGSTTYPDDAANEQHHYLDKHALGRVFVPGHAARPSQAKGRTNSEQHIMDHRAIGRENEREREREETAFDGRFIAQF